MHRVYTVRQTLRQHWPEYLMEAAELGGLMFAVCCFATLYQHPDSPIRQAIADPLLRRVLMGATVALLLIGIIYSPWGARSGGHFNPVVTMTFLRLGKIAPWDALFYIVAQFAGGLLGVLAAARLLGPALADPAVRYAVTVPGPTGPLIAFLAELLIAFIFMTMVLNSSNTPHLARYTGVFVGALVATYIVVESPFSGTSMNPARSFASAAPAQIWTALWIYFTAPLLGMLAAAELYLRRSGAPRVRCAKINHREGVRCIFNCGYRSDAQVAEQRLQQKLQRGER